MIETYAHGRDEDGELLNDSVEEEFSLTLAPPSWLLNRQAAAKPIATARQPANEPSPRSIV
eukprot:3702577-Pleurochrysis_carterae.AAC.1